MFVAYNNVCLGTFQLHNDSLLFLEVMQMKNSEHFLNIVTVSLFEELGMNRGIVNIHLGQCGVQTADSLWGLLCLEHDVCLDGTIKKKQRKNLDLDSNRIFFEECSNGKYVPRSVIVDTEPTVVDVIRTGRKRNLFRPDCLISAKDDSGNVFARGYYTMADDLSDLTMDRVRKVVESCSSIQGFTVYRSYGGGTGSGFGSAILTSLRDDYPKTTQIEIATVPGGKYSTAVVEPYNAVFATHESLMNADCALFFDNEALYSMLSKKLEMHSPTYVDINRMISQVISAMTAGLRFSSTLKIDFTEVQTNLVPYPRLHFPVASFSPIMPKTTTSMHMDTYLKHMGYSADYLKYSQQMDTVKITKNLFNKYHFTLMGDPSMGKYMSCCIMYRGLVVPKEINATINILKRARSIQFVDWCPTGFKIGISNTRMVIPRRLNMEATPTSAIMLANTTSIHEYFSLLNTKYDLMNRKRAFWHHYIQEGMPEDDFVEFREDLAALEMDYLEVGEDTRLIDEDYQEDGDLKVQGDQIRLSNILEDEDSKYSVGDDDESTKTLSAKSDELAPSLSL